MVYEVSPDQAFTIGNHFFARSKDLINWERTTVAMTPDSTPGGNDGSNWCVIDGELYVFVRALNNSTTAIKIVPVQ